MKIVGSACLVVLTLGSSLLFAEPLPAEIIQARRLFVEARAREENKEWEVAAAKLREAIAIKETAGLRFHLAYCEEQQGLLVEALVDYDRLEEIPAQKGEDFRAQLPSKRESLHKRIPTLTIVMPRDVTNAALSVDSHELPPSFLGNPVSLNPGRHTAELSAPGRIPFTVDLVMREGDAVVTNASMPPVAKPPAKPALPPVVTQPAALPAAPQPTPLPTASSSGAGRTVLLIGEAAIAVGGLALGIGYMVAAGTVDERITSDREKLNANNPDGIRQACVESADPPVSPKPMDVDLCRSIQANTDLLGKDKYVSSLAFIGAGVGAAAFLGTLLVWPAQSRVAVTPLLGPKATGFTAVLTF